MKKITKYIIILIILLIVGGGVTAGIFLTKKPTPVYTFATAQKRNLVEEVSATGQVKPAQKIDLSFEQSGKVASVMVQTGDSVKTGQILAQLNTAQIQAQIRQAQANVASAQATLLQTQASLDNQNILLAQLKKGTRIEEIQIAEIKVANAKITLTDTQNDLATANQKAQQDLDNAYSNGLVAASQALSNAMQVLFTIGDLQTAHFYDTQVVSLNLAEAKADAIFILLGTQNAGRWTNDYISELTGGAKADIVSAQNNSTPANIDRAISQTLAGLTDLQETLNIIPQTTTFTALEITNLSSAKSTTNTEISNLNTKYQAILSQKVTNQVNIETAQSAVNTAQAALNNAQADLSLKLAGSTPEAIDSQEAQVKQAQANVASQDSVLKQSQANLANLQAQAEKSSLYSPIDGVITRQDLKIGQIASPGASAITLMTNKQYQIEANVAEVDISKIAFDNLARITLDAYGQDTFFEARMIKIDPAETMIEGVANYKITLELTKDDDRFKSGMTANIDIISQQKDNVLAIPQRAVISKDGQRFVRTLENKTPREIEVKTGIKSSDGYMEILQGLSQGDQIIVSEET